jgi:hypothetical protein
MKKLTVLGLIGGAALLASVPASLQWSPKGVSLSLDSADARVGRPLTPMSVAGVQRRTYRRAYRGAAYAGAAAAGYGVYSGYGYPSYYSSYAPQSYYGGYSGYSTAPYNPGPSFGFGWRY